MYGWSEEEARRMNIGSLVPAHKKEESAAIMRGRMSANGVQPFTTNRLCKDGSEIKVWLTVSKVVDDRGEIIGLATTERELPQSEK